MVAEERTFRPASFNDVEGVAVAFRAGGVVDLMLDLASRDDRRRLIDFASGMVLGANGTFEKIGPQHFRLSNGSPPPPRGPQTSGDREPRGPRPLLRTDSAARPVQLP